MDVETPPEGTGTGAPDSTENQTEPTSSTETASQQSDDKASREIARMANALKGRQSEIETLKSEIEAMKAEQERAKLTEEERRQADLAALEQRAKQFEFEAQAAKDRIALVETSAALVAKHGVVNLPIAETIAKQFDPAAHESFDAFVESIKQDQTWASVFRQPPGTQAAPAPAAPGSAAGRQGAPDPEAEFQKSVDRVHARRRNVPRSVVEQAMRKTQRHNRNS